MPVFSKDNYQNIFIVDNLGYFNQIQNLYDAEKDLVLTYDFALFKKLSDKKSEVYFLDSLGNPEEFNIENFNIYDYFSKWHCDELGKDYFVFKGIEFGFSFRQEIWNDFIYHIRLIKNFEIIKKLNHKQLFIGSNDQALFDVCNYLNFKFTIIDALSSSKSEEFYFPMMKWFNQAVRPKGLKAKFRDVIYFILPWIIFYLDSILIFKKKKIKLYIQNYHPTKDIINSLRLKYDISTERFSNYFSVTSLLHEKPIPIFKTNKKHKECGTKLISEFKLNQYNDLILSSGRDITAYITTVILNKIEPKISEYISLLDSIIYHYDSKPIALEIPVTNIGILNSLIHCYCKKRKIPSFLIINGMLGQYFQDESKHADIINCYSQSIRDNYFKNCKNVYPLGDPRMDNYAKKNKNIINNNHPTITIGTANFNPTDINSFSAVEFMFMYDILDSIQEQIVKGREAKIIIKMRPNGYINQYKQFIKEYFPNLTIDIINYKPMIDVLQETDLYISIYSQTVIEAATLGIPTLYYKIDNEMMHPPFEFGSELLIVCCKDNLDLILDNFYKSMDLFQPFLKLDVLEKYIGPLDGKNLKRNINHIEQIINGSLDLHE